MRVSLYKYENKNLVFSRLLADTYKAFLQVVANLRVPRGKGQLLFFERKPTFKKEKFEVDVNNNLNFRMLNLNRAKIEEAPP